MRIKVDGENVGLDIRTQPRSPWYHVDGKGIDIPVSEIVSRL